MYKTGDIVRESTVSGDIEYLGRSDFQVKLRGMRVELGDIEAAIVRQEDVDVVSSASVVLNDTIFAFVVLKDVQLGSSMSSQSTAIHNAILRLLPAYMVPSERNIRFLPQLPLTSNGKLDRKALMAMAEESINFKPPSSDSNFSTLTPLEAELIGIFRFFQLFHLT